MGAMGPRSKAERARERADCETIIAFSKAIDPNSPLGGEKKSLRTVETYTDKLRILQDRSEKKLLELTTLELVELFEGLQEDYSGRSVEQFLSACKAFYRHFDDHDVSINDITIKPNDDKSVDLETVLTRQEFHNLRDEMENPRDRCIIDLLAYTGQRIRVIQTLRIKDVDPHEGETGTYRINTTVDGLKGVDKAMKKRPLLGAKRSVTDWLSYHPTKEPTDYLITVIPGWGGHGTPGEMVAQNTIRRPIKNAAKKANIDKPVNPHAFRHYFATAAKTEFGMDDETVRRLLGHGANSRIMETTYRHLSDDDIIKDAEKAFGADVEERRTTPPMCPTCYVPLPGGLKSCPTASCNEVFDPDATSQTGLAQNLTNLDSSDLAELQQQLEAIQRWQDGQ